MFYKRLTSSNKDDITHSRPKCVQMFSINAQFIYLSVLQCSQKSYLHKKAQNKHSLYKIKQFIRQSYNALR